MKKTLLLAMVLIAGALGMRAQTEFSGSVEAESAPWSNSDVYYGMDGVATALGFDDAAALVAALDAQTVVITAPDQDGNPTSAPTSYYTRGDVEGYSYGCFWMDAAGKTVAGWNAAGVVIANHFDFDDSNIIIHLLQNTADNTVPGTYTATITLTANEKSAVLKSSITIAEPEPVAPLPVAVKNIAALDIVDVVTLELEQPVMKGWDGSRNPQWAVDIQPLLDEGADEGVIAANAWKLLAVREDASNNMLFIGDKDGDYTANGGGYWFKRASDDNGFCIKSDWGAYPDFFIEEIVYDAETHQFKGGAGQMIEKFQVGDQFNTDFYFVYGEKAIKVEFSLTVVEEEEIDMPEPVTEIAKLTIVDKVTVEVTQPIMKDWGENPFWTADATALLDATGVEPATFQQVIRKMLHGQVWDSNAEAVAEETQPTDTYTANAPGYWFVHSTIEDEATGDLVTTEDCYVGVYGSSDFFVEYVGFDTETNEFYGWAGQMINKFSGGEHFQTKFYFIYGDKALEVDFHFNVEKPKEYNIEDMQKVGETAVMTWVQEPRSDESGLEHWIQNIDEVSQLLGCPAGNFVLKCKLPDGTVTSQYTTTTTSVENGVYGFWIDETGNVITSDPSAVSFYVEYSAANNRGSFTIGQMPNVLVPGDKLSATLWLCNEDKYYEVIVNLNVEDLIKADPEEYQEVDSYTFNFQGLVDVSWDLTQNYSDALDMTAVMEKLGTEDIAVYALSEGEWTKGYTCTPYPGFWFTPEGVVTGWGSAKVGMIFERDHIQMFKNPLKHDDNPEADVKVGDQLQHSIYLVNEFTGAYIRVTANVEFVDKIISYQDMGDMTVTIAMDADGTGVQEFDGEKVLKMIGLMLSTFEENGSVMPRTAEGQYAPLGQYSINDEIMFDARGNALPSDAEYSNFKLLFEMDEVVGCRIYATADTDIDGMVLPADGIYYKTDVLFQNEGYRYFVHVQLKFEEPDCIASVEDEDESKSGTYDLNGVPVENPSDGIYIIDGKKVYVK